MPFNIESDEEFEVEEILESQMRGEHPYYRVKWTDSNEYTWHNLSDLTCCHEALEHFHRHYPNQSGEAHWRHTLNMIEDGDYIP